MRWEPIETAPKEEQLLVAAGREYAHVIWHSYDDRRGEWSLVHVGDYASSSNIDFEPTHWCRLEAPEEQLPPLTAG